MIYPLIEVANEKIAYQDATVGTLLTLAKINEKSYESQLTTFLANILSPASAEQGMIDPLKLTAEERYCHLLSYLNLTIDRNALYQKTDPAAYLADDLNAFSRDRVRSEKMSVRHLTGMEATALEKCCEFTEDWILGEMAITIGLDERLPEIDLHTSLEFTAKTIELRIEVIKNFTDDEFNNIYDEYLGLKDQQMHLVNIAFDNGIVLEKFNQRGADDAPRRFRPAHAFTRHAKDLLSVALGGIAAIQH